MKPHSTRMLWVLLTAFVLARPSVSPAQDDPNQNPTGPSGDYNGEVTTAGSYDPLTQNAKRAVTDLVVPGSNGTYPLAFTRIYNSAMYLVSNEPRVLGDGGNWRHSYLWTITQVPGTGTARVCTVAYPDGGAVTFRPQTSRSSTPSGEYSTYWHGPAGTQDRLEVPGNGGLLCLHRSDGSLVYFGGILRAVRIVDPYGATTILNYDGGNNLSQVIEPGGRSLNFGYTPYTETVYDDGNGHTQSMTWVLLTSVTASTGQEVDYAYQDTGAATKFSGGSNNYTYSQPYKVLSSVTYKAEPNGSSAGYVQASYTYECNGGSIPVVTTAYDPHYAGAMVSIRYLYTYTGSGLIQEEENPTSSTTGERVSNLSRNYSGGQLISTETRGDKDASGSNIARAFWYGEANKNGSATNAKASQLTTATDYQGNPTYLAYYGAGDGNGEGNLARITDALQHTTYYAHEPYAGKVYYQQLPDGRARRWNWLAKDLSTQLQPYYLYQYTDERSQTTTYKRYPNTGLVNEIDYPDGGKETFSYTGWTVNGNTFYKVYCHTDVRGAQTINGYDETDTNHGGSGHAGLLTSVTRAYADAAGNGHSERTVLYYDAMDRLNQSVDPRGVGTFFVYNGRHQLTGTTHASDNTHIDRFYDDLGNCTDVHDELGHGPHFGYDNYRRVTLVVTPVNDGTNDHHVDYYSYDPRDTSNNSLASATSHTRSTWSLYQQQSSRATLRVFSPNNWLTDTFAGMSAAGSSHVVYTAVGLPQTSTDQFGYQTTYTYDICNRLATTTDPNGHISSSTYYGAGETASGGGNQNCAGLLKSTTVPGPDLSTPTVTTSFANYDQMGRLRQSVGPTNSYTVNSITFDSGFNQAGDLTSQDDGAQGSGGHTTGYGYDQLGRKASLSYPDGTTESWAYDASGNVSTYKNRANQTKTYSYDGRNRLTYMSWSNNAAPSTAYEYDAANRMTRVYNNTSDNHFTYSQAGEMLTETAQLPSMPLKTITYSHDIDGRVTAILYPRGDQPHFDYDTQGKCTGVWFGNNVYYTRYNYDGRAMLSTRCLPSIGVDTGYVYQHNGRVSWYQHQHGDAQGNLNGASIRLQFYGYAPAGQVSWTYRVAGGDQTGRNSQIDNNEGDAYYYFGDGSLNAAWRNVGIQNNNWPQQMDPVNDARVDPGNLIGYGGPAPSDVRAFPFDPAGNRTSSGNSNYAYTYNPDGENRYTGMGYDANGNTTSPNDGFTYTYNAENQLIMISNSNGAPVTYFAYDGLGRMWGDNYNGLARAYYYAGSQRIEEWNNSTQAPLNSYFFDGPGSDSIFLRLDYQRGYLWYLYDAQGNTTHLCDSNGNVLEMYLYDAWGTPTVYDPYGNVRAGGSAYDNRYLFRGAAAYQWYTPASLYYARARFYQPYHGRWLQPDPIGQAGGLNIYAYCGNDPINGVDPSGLASPSDSQTGEDKPKLSNGIGLTGDMAWAFNSTGGAQMDDMGGYFTSTRSVYIETLDAKTVNSDFRGQVDVYDVVTVNAFMSGVYKSLDALGYGLGAIGFRQSSSSYDWRTDYRDGTARDADKVMAQFASGQPLGDAVKFWRQTANAVGQVAGYSTALGVVGAALDGLPLMEIAVGEGEPFHVAFRVGDTMLNGIGNRIGWQAMRILPKYAAGTFANPYFTMELPVLFPGAVAATQGATASSCATAAAYAFYKGWFPW